jgi:hypothetical protein
VTAMETRFARLFGLKILHEWYSDQYGKDAIGRDFAVLPTQTCLQTLRGHQLIFKNRVAGADIICPFEIPSGNNNLKKPARPIQGPIVFSFMLIARNPLLVNYSDLPMRCAQQQIYRFANLFSHTDSQRVYLSKQGQASSQDRIKLAKQSFMYCETFSDIVDSAVIKVEDEFGNTVFKDNSPLIQAHTVETDGSPGDPASEKKESVISINIDLHDVQPGKFMLSVDNHLKHTFYAGNELIRRNVFGIIDIFHNDSVPKDNRFINDQSGINEKTYIVNFQRRTRVWRYNIVLKYTPKIDPSQISVLASNASIKFNKTVPVNGSQQPKTIQFTSSDELPMQEAPIKGIQLLAAIGTRTIHIKDLPNPSAANITENDEQNDKIYSDVFIYL